MPVGGRIGCHFGIVVWGWVLVLFFGGAGVVGVGEPEGTRCAQPGTSPTAPGGHSYQHCGASADGIH